MRDRSPYEPTLAAPLPEDAPDDAPRGLGLLLLVVVTGLLVSIFFALS